MRRGTLRHRTLCPKSHQGYVQDTDTQTGSSGPALATSTRDLERLDHAAGLHTATATKAADLRGQPAPAPASNPAAGLSRSSCPRDLPTLTNPARPNPRHLTTEPCNPRLEGPGQGTREGGDLASHTAPHGTRVRPVGALLEVGESTNQCSQHTASRSRPASTFRLLPRPLSLNPLSFP